MTAQTVVTFPARSEASLPHQVQRIKDLEPDFAKKERELARKRTETPRGKLGKQ
jgi:hypothetical protein